MRKKITNIFVVFVISSGGPFMQRFDRKPAQSQLENRSIFKNVTQSMGLPGSFTHNQTLVADLNQDNFLDLILTKNYLGKFETKVFLNQSGKSFKEVNVSGFSAKLFAVLKIARGLFNPDVWGVIVRYPNQALEAYNLIVTKSSVKFIRIDSNKFPSTVSNWGDIQIFDYNQDGKLDFLGTSYYKGGSNFIGGPVYLFEQKSDNTFEDISIKTGLQTKDELPMHSPNAPVPSYMANVCDINNDGYLDLLVAGYGRRWNQLYIYTNGKYVNSARALKFDADEIGREDFRGNGNSFSSQCADVNEDGKLDVFQGEITHEWAGETSDVSSLLYNNYPQPFKRFIAFPREKKFENQGDLSADFGDINLDGHLDLVISNSDYPPETRLVTLLIREGEVFSNISKSFEAVTNPKGAVLFDFDRDGDLDLVMGESAMRGHKNPSMKLFKNMTQEYGPKPFANFILEGDGKKIAQGPVGARVIIKNSPRRLMRELVFGGGQDSSRPLEAHFALGQMRDQLLEVEIKWNDKTTEHFELDRNKTYKITFRQTGSKIEVVSIP